MTLTPSLILPFAAASQVAPVEFGLWAFVFSLSTIALLNDWGSSYLAQCGGSEGVIGRRMALQLTVVGSIPATAIFGAVALAVLAFEWPATIDQLGFLLLLFWIVSIGRIHQQVMSGALLNLRRYSSRVWSSFAGAAATLALGIGALIARPSMVNVTLALLAGAAVSSAASWMFAQRIIGESSLTAADRRFIRSRIFVNATNSVVTQGDRTIVLAILGPAALVPYDLAMRVIAAGKTLAISTTTGLAADARRLVASRIVRRVRSSSQKLVVVLFVAGTLSVALTAAAAAELGVAAFTRELVVLLVILGAGHAVHVATAPVTAIAAGLADNSLEQRYLLVSLLAIAIFLPFAAVRGTLPALAAAIAGGLAVGAADLFIRLQRREDFD